MDSRRQTEAGRADRAKKLSPERVDKPGGDRGSFHTGNDHASPHSGRSDGTLNPDDVSFNSYHTSPNHSQNAFKTANDLNRTTGGTSESKLSPSDLKEGDHKAAGPKLERGDTMQHDDDAADNKANQVDVVVNQDSHAMEGFGHDNEKSQHVHTVGRKSKLGALQPSSKRGETGK